MTEKRQPFGWVCKYPRFNCFVPIIYLLFHYYLLIKILEICRFTPGWHDVYTYGTFISWFNILFFLMIFPFINDGYMRNELRKNARRFDKYIRWLAFAPLIYFFVLFIYICVLTFSEV